MGYKFFEVELGRVWLKEMELSTCNVCIEDMSGVLHLLDMSDVLGMTPTHVVTLNHFYFFKLLSVSV